MIAVFIYINSIIFISDIKEKIIPNKQIINLLSLLPFVYLTWFSFWLYADILFLSSFILQIIAGIILSFTLYCFWIWSAWDAKYLLVLSLFIPHIGIIPFVGNIAIISIVYLVLYFFYFYIWKCCFIKWYARGLYSYVIINFKDVWSWKLKNNNWKIERYWVLKKISGILFHFLLLFTIIRLARIYIIDGLILNNNTEWLKEIITNYSSYIFIWIIIAFIASLYLIKVLFLWIKKYIILWFPKIKSYINITFQWILSIGLILFIINEYQLNPDYISKTLLLIFTLYISLYIICKILWFFYKITFQLWEQNMINIKYLQVWDIVDKEHLVKIFWINTNLWFKQEKWLLSPDPRVYFKKIQNPIDAQTYDTLLQVYDISEKQHKHNTHWEPFKDIKILKTFAFAPYIYAGFILTYIIDDQIFQYVFNYIATWIWII